MNKPFAACLLAISIPFLTIALPSPAQTATTAPATRSAPNQTSTDERNALTLAMNAYVRRFGPSIDAMERPNATPFRIDFDFGDFARAGDTLWEVRSARFDGAKQDLVRSIYWVNLRNQQVELIFGRKPQDDSTKAASRTLVRTWYVKHVEKMEANFKVDASDFQLAYDLPAFAQRGTKLVEVRISTPDGTRAIVWVNPNKGGTLYPLTGPWQTQPVTTAPALRAN